VSTEGNQLTHGDVERIVQFAEDAGYGYVRFEVDGLEVTLVKEGYVEQDRGGGGEAALATDGHADPTGAAQARTTPTSPASVPATPSPPSSEPDVEDPADGSVLIRSPMVGIFYRAPDPDSPPYVEVGQIVEPGDTIGLVEVMKMYTAIHAETHGRVAEILAEDALRVDRGQPLVRVESS
jgi:acetyl-CoA carboxylase biotin carboxyl carrier protein